MTAKDIQKALEIKYKVAQYCVPNIYFFDYPYLVNKKANAF